MVRKVKLQIKAHFFNPCDQISIISFPTTFRLPCDTNRMLEHVAVCLVPILVQNTFATTLNSLMSAETPIVPVVVAVSLVEPMTQKKLLSFLP